MSGDVQPRKRKDKKRKKDDSQEQIPVPPQTPSVTFSTSNQNDDINIHVHKDEGTGGGICAKIIFFLLFSALAVLIGLIITEHRGLTDLDTQDSDSRFSQLFEGWTDNTVGHDDHDDADHIVNSLEDEDHEEESHEGHDEDEEEEAHDEHGEEEEASEEVAQSEEEEEEEEEEEGSEEAPRTEEDDDEEDDEEPAASEAEDEDEASELKEDDDDDEEEEASPENVEEDEEDEEQQEEASQEVEQSVEEEPEEEEEEPDDGGSDEAADDAGSEEAADEGSKEAAASEEEEAAEQSEEKASEEAKEEQPVSKEEIEPEVAEAKEDGQQNSKMVVKIGVGVALLVVAHVVLVRKWKSATPESAHKEEIPDLSRRKTIVVPPAYQDVQQDVDEAEEEYSDEDGEVDSEEEREAKSGKAKYGELRTTYVRSLTPESEPEYQTKADEEEYEDEEDEEGEDEDEEEEEEDEDESDGEYEKEEEDEDLLKRLEARYGKLKGGKQEPQNEEGPDDRFESWKRIHVVGDNEPEESDSDKQSDPETYEYENITNKDDHKIKEKLDAAHKNIQNNTAYAIKLFDVLLQKYSSSPRSLYGKALCLDLLADQRKSNHLLQKAINIYLEILNLDKVPEALFTLIADRCINRMRFIGNYNNAIEVHNKLILRFPDQIKYRNQLVVSYLTINRVNKARLLLQDILSKYPNDGSALVHYGFILKTIDNKLSESVSYLQRGDALARLGKKQEAMAVYEDGVKHNLFLSKYQRALYNVDRLKGQPWWKKSEMPYAALFTALEKNWDKIREEGMSVLNKNGLFQKESENLKDTGDWKQFELFARGQKNLNNCKRCPATCQIIESFPDAKSCKRGQTKFSVMHPGTHVWPHCGPTNCRLRVHLGLKVPPHTYIRVADEIRSWKDGEVFIFDDSFEHEVWHNGTSVRLVLIVDVWHPELTAEEKRSLSPI